jgi:hypothetical protein
VSARGPEASRGDVTARIARSPSETSHGEKRFGFALEWEDAMGLEKTHYRSHAYSR